MQAFGEKKYILYIKTRNYIYVDTKTKNNKNYLLKNNLNNFCARVRQLKRTELAWRVGSAQCLRSPHKLQICGDPDRSNRTAKPIVRPKGDKNFLARQGKQHIVSIGI